MFGHWGFSYIGLLFLLMLLIPNIIWSKRKPQGYTSEKENKILLFFERVGEVLTCCCSLAFSNFNIYEWTLWSLWLIAAFLVYPLPGQRCQSGTTSVICNLQKKIGPDCREGVRAQVERMKKKNSGKNAIICMRSRTI